MSDKVDVKNLVSDVLAEFKAQQEEEARKKAEFEAAVAEKLEEEKEKLKEEAKKDAKAWLDEQGTVNVMSKARTGSEGDSEDGPMDAFRYWMRTGDEIPVRKAGLLYDTSEDGESRPTVDAETVEFVEGHGRKALSGASGAAGEYLMPDGFQRMIIEKRDPMSFPRIMGVSVFNAGRSRKVDLPAEDTSLTKFVRTAELGSYDTNDPTFAQNQVDVEKWTKLTKFSEEILEDDQAGLEDWYARALSRAMAATEAYYVAVGSGTNQHEGIFEGGTTNAFTFDTDGGADSDGNITFESLWKFYYTLGEGYQVDAEWLMDPQTLATIVSLSQSNEPVFGGAQMLQMGADGRWRLLGKPVNTQDDIPVKASGTAFIAIGSPYYYSLVEKKGLTIQRNPYLYQASGEVGFFSHFRQSGKVTNASAWICGQGA